VNAWWVIRLSLFVLDLEPTLGASAVVNMGMVFTPVVTTVRTIPVPAKPLLPPSQDAHRRMMPDLVHRAVAALMRGRNAMVAAVRSADGVFVLGLFVVHLPERP
jgi:hypothetical protein